MNKLIIIAICIALVCGFNLTSYAKDKKHEIRTPEFKIDVPKDHLFLVAVDRGQPGNRKFIENSGKNKAPGVDPISGQMMRLPAEVRVSLAYPKKRLDNKSSNVMWTVYAGYKYSENDSNSPAKSTNAAVKVDMNWTLKMDWELGYNFKVATEVQKIIYQDEGRVYNDYVRNIIETPIKPTLQEVETGIKGTKLYQIPFGEVNGVTRYIVILISDDFDSARNVLKISNQNPKFKWNTDWFHKQPTSK